jgi:hypothetical protein
MALALGTSAEASDPLQFPPVPVSRSLYLLDVPFLHLGPLEELPPPGWSALGIQVAYGNTFSHSWHATAIKSEFGTLGRPLSRAEAEELHARHPEDQIFFIDGEVARIAVRGGWRLSERIAVSLEVPFVSFDALRGDRAIEGFHEGFGLHDAQRPNFPRGRFQVVRQRPFGALEFDDRIPASGLGDVVGEVLFRSELANGTRLGAALSVKAPTGSADDYRGSGSWDGGITLGIGRSFGASRRTYLRLEAGVVRPGPFRGDVPLRLEADTFLRVLAAGQLRIGRRTFASLSVVVEQSPFRRDALGDGSLTAVEIGLGVSRTLGERTLLELGLVENAPMFGDAPDIALTLGVRLFP